MRRSEKTRLARALEARRASAAAHLDALRAAAAIAAAAPEPCAEDLPASTTDLDAAVEEIAWGLLRSIEDAQERLARGRYGECLDCGRAIPSERLFALPFARLCAACSAAAEALGHAPGPHPHGLRCALCGRTLPIQWPVRTALCRCGAPLASGPARSEARG